jgi:hypothetical protein
MSIKRIAFIHPVEVGGDFASITSWMADKHGKAIEVTEKGAYLILRIAASGETRRVPISNVSHISEDAPAKDGK